MGAGRRDVHRGANADLVGEFVVLREVGAEQPRRRVPGAAEPGMDLAAIEPRRRQPDRGVELLQPGSFVAEDAAAVGPAHRLRLGEPIDRKMLAEVDEPRERRLAVDLGVRPGLRRRIDAAVKAQIELELNAPLHRRTPRGKAFLGLTRSRSGPQRRQRPGDRAASPGPPHPAPLLWVRPIAGSAEFVGPNADSVQEPGQELRTAAPSLDSAAVGEDAARGRTRPSRAATKQSDATQCCYARNQQNEATNATPLRNAPNERSYLPLASAVCISSRVSA